MLFLSPDYFHSPYAISLITAVYNALNSSTVSEYSYTLVCDLVSNAHERTSLRQADRSELSVCSIKMKRVIIQYFELAERLELNFRVWFLPMFCRSSTVRFSVLLLIIPATTRGLFLFGCTDLI